MNYFNNLKIKLKKRKLTVCIVGVGYVGQAIIKKILSKNINVIALDKNIEKIKKIFKFKKVFYTKNYKHVGKADIIVICLPTPLKKNKTPDLSHLKAAIKSMKNFLKKGQMISLESTTYPGSTQELFIPLINQKRFKLSENFFLVYSPERISPELKIKDKSIKYNISNTPKLCAGYSKKCEILGKSFYRLVTKKVIIASSLKVAEASKMIENVFRSVNIALVNELKMFLDKIKINIHEVLNLAGTKPYGFTKFDPGPGYGGHCIPLDPYYLYWLAKKNKFDLKFVKTSGEINRNISFWITSKIFNFIKKRKIKLIKKKILILGVAYKKNIVDTRESPAFKISENIIRQGYDVEFSDPYIKTIKVNGKTKRSKKINKHLFKKFKVVIIVTDHDKFDYKLIKDSAKYLFDCRNSIKGRKKDYFSI